METTELERLKYPIGYYVAPDPFTEQDIASYMSDIARFPEDLESVVNTMNQKQLDTPYRPGGWTGRQVIHHIADSHMNALIRFKLALTEDMPAIKPYFEDKWAELGDYQNTPIEVSLNLTKVLHIKWTILLKTMSRQDFEQIYFHPEHGREFSLEEAAGVYAWHGKHHIAHLEMIKNN